MSALSSLVFKVRRSFANTRYLMQEQSSFKVVFILLFAVAMVAGLLVLFLDGFRFLSRLGGTGTMIIGRLFSLFFLGMGMMLVVSGVVASYSTIFRSDEMPFLVVRPFEASHIVVYKLLEAMLLSSWAFFFIIIPFAGAYAVHEHLSVLFAAWTFLFSIPFLVICSATGAIITILVVRWFPRSRLPRICGVVLAAGVVFFLWRLGRGARGLLGATTFDLSRLVPGLGMASNELLPSYWTSEGIMSLVRGQWLRGGMLWGTLVSTALMMIMLAEWTGSSLFYRAWERVCAGGTRRRHAPILLGWMERPFSVFAADTRGLILKDIRVFLRDPMQWSQVLIFFGLLALYFSNLRTFRYHVLPDRWRNMISFLNVFSISAVMCSLGSRFVYPQLSLEGQAFWVVGLSPTRMSRVLGAKFATALTGMLCVSVGLALLSGSMLKAPPSLLVTAVALACAISLAVAALSTGLGAIFLDLKQRNPSAIVSGFGGTLNLVVSLGFMLAVIIPFAVTFHLHFIRKLGPRWFARNLCLSASWTFLLTAAATVIPLWLANRSLERREF